MTLAEDIQASAAEIGASAQAAAERVTAVIGELRGQLETVRAELQEALDSDSAEDTVLQSALDGLANADSLIDSIEPAPAGEEPPAEEPPAEEPPAEEPQA